MWRRLLLATPGPATRLGRWCTPAYDARCDPGLKAVLSSRDHSLHAADMAPPPPPRRATAAEAEQREVDRCPWSNPTLATLLFGR